MSPISFLGMENPYILDPAIAAIVSEDTFSACYADLLCNEYMIENFYNSSKIHTVCR